MSEWPKLTVDQMMTEMREAGVFERAEQRIKEHEARTRRLFSSPAKIAPTVTVRGVEPIQRGTKT